MTERPIQEEAGKQPIKGFPQDELGWNNDGPVPSRTSGGPTPLVAY